MKASIRFPEQKSKAPHLPGPEGTRAVQCRVLRDPHRGSLAQVQGKAQDGEAADYPLPLLVSPCPGSDSGPESGMY